MNLKLPLLLSCSLAAALVPAQSLRASSAVQLVSPSGNLSAFDEKAWSNPPAGVLDSAVDVVNLGGSAEAAFSAQFGRLRGRTSARVLGGGLANSSAVGRFASFTNFVGAGMFDTIEFVGTGVVTLRINYRLHTVNTTSDARAHAESQFKLDVFLPGFTNGNRPAIAHSGPGSFVGSDSFEVSAPAGTTMDLLAELSGFASARLGAGESGDVVGTSDAWQTARIQIVPVVGNFSSLSGATYAEPVPEPVTLVAVLPPLLACAGRRRSRRPQRPRDHAGSTRR